MTTSDVAPAGSHNEPDDAEKLRRVYGAVFGAGTKDGLLTEHGRLSGALFGFIGEMREAVAALNKDRAALSKWVARRKAWLLGALFFLVCSSGVSCAGVGFLAARVLEHEIRLQRLEPSHDRPRPESTAAAQARRPGQAGARSRR